MANPHSARINRVKVLRIVLVLVGLIFILYVERRSKRPSTRLALSCPPCSCDCISETTLSMLSDFFNDSFTDCGKNDPETYNEMKKDIIALMTEEVSLHANVTSDALQRTNMQIMGAKRASLHFQKEADKCIVGVETCEEARERAEVSLIEQRKLTALWISRAREYGWGDWGNEMNDNL